MNDSLMSRLELLPPQVYPEPDYQLGNALSNTKPTKLVTTRSDGRGHMVFSPATGTAFNSNKQADWVCTIGQDCTEVTLNILLTALKGGSRYPYISATMGVALAGMIAVVGEIPAVIAVGAGALYGETNATVSYGQGEISRDFLPRRGDRIVRIQQFGKVKADHLFAKDQLVPVYVCVYALVDPYRMKGKCGTQGWVLGETRLPISLA